MSRPRKRGTPTAVVEVDSNMLYRVSDMEQKTANKLCDTGVFGQKIHKDSHMEETLKRPTNFGKEKTEDKGQYILR